jgi:tetratricopeptide (TPR) repeat protein
VSEQPAQQLAEPVTPAAAAQPELMAPSEPPVPAPASKAPAEGNTYRILAEAREAYWLRDYETAESLYRQLTTMEPDNPDGYGELGNMYFSQGMWELAASAYFEAGTRLVKEGQLEQARQLVDVIRGLDGTQAEELNKRIAAAQADTH